jgi:hypothetical protein
VVKGYSIWSGKGWLTPPTVKAVCLHKNEGPELRIPCESSDLKDRVVEAKSTN